MISINVSELESFSLVLDFRSDATKVREKNFLLGLSLFVSGYVCVCIRLSVSLWVCPSNFFLSASVSQPWIEIEVEEIKD